MPSTRTNGYRSHTRDSRPSPRPMTDSQKLLQKYWRKDCLLTKIAAGTMTEKNWKEAEALGIKGFVTGEVAPGVKVTGIL